MPIRSSMSEEDSMQQQMRFWQERRSSIRMGNCSVDSMQRLSSMASMKQSTDLYETRETASSLPTLEEISNECYSYVRSPVEILMGKIEVSRGSLLQCVKQLDALQVAFQRIAGEVVELGQQTLIMKRLYKK